MASDRRGRRDQGLEAQVKGRWSPGCSGARGEGGGRGVDGRGRDLLGAGGPGLNSGGFVWV